MDHQEESDTPVAPLRGPRHRHISRSAAKRESVQLLGSIKDLQAHFARAGFVEHRAGAGVGVKGTNLNTLGEDDEGGDDENRPPPPVLRERRTERKAWKEVELPRIDPAAARIEARRIAHSMRSTWSLPSSGSSSGSSSLVPSPSIAFHSETSQPDTRSTLVRTAQSVRTIRNLALAIAHAHRSTDRRASASAQLHPRTGSKLRTSFSTPSRPTGMPRAVSLGMPERKSSLGPLSEGPQEDVHSDLRKAAIEVLASLRALEEKLRTEASEVEEEMPRTSSPVESTGTSSTAVNTSTTLTSRRPSSSARSTNFSDPDEYYYEDEDEYNLNALAQADAEREHTQTWEERLVAENRQYRDLRELDVVDETLSHVEDSISKWLKVVERIFHVSQTEATEVGSWVSPELWEGRSEERLQTFLTSYLPLQLQLLIPSTADPDFQSSFLSKISDGYIIIQVFNAVVLASRKPWGFVPDEDVHDTISTDSAALSGEGSKEWTFRRTGNLTCWAAALRHRYNLPVNLPVTATASSLVPKPSTLPSRSPGPSPVLGALPTAKVDSSASGRMRDGQRIDFDPSLVAKKGDDWEIMFETLLCRWLEEAAREARDSVSDTQVAGMV